MFSVERGKTDLYKVALLIREGNKLSQLKSMPTVSYLFSMSTQLLYYTCIVHSVYISFTTACTLEIIFSLWIFV